MAAMREVEGSRVVITGGASGIGSGLATACAERGAAAVVLADVEEPALDDAVAALSASFPGADVVAAPCDVTDRGAVQGVAAICGERFGGADLVFLNAGVFAGGRSWEATDDDWDWVMGVNVRGVVNGIRAFVPGMIDAGTPAHVFVTASVAGVVAAPVSAPYVTSKYAVVGIAEGLHHDLELVGAPHVGVSVICPAMVSTNIGDCERNRPAALADATRTDGTAMARIGIDDAMARGLDPLEGARNVLDQAAAGRFWVSTHPVELWERLVGNENEDRVAGRPPRFQMYE